MQPFRIPPAVGQFAQDSGGGALEQLAFGLVHNGGCGSSDACDVLQKEELRVASIGDVEDAEEKAAARAIKADTPPGDTEVLAREARSDDIHEAAQHPAIEGREIVPDKCRSQGRRRHPRHESGRGVAVPLNVTKSAVVASERVESRRDAFVKHRDAGAEGETGKFGTWSHIYFCHH